jgi:CheY-like chemotaxis protein
MTRICKVLIVENDDGVRDTLANVVEDEGYLFATLKTGRELTSANVDDDYDIVIIDVTQPGPEDGFALARVARERGCGVILMTGDHRFLETLQKSIRVRGEIHSIDPPGEDEPAADVPARYSGDRFVTDSPLEEDGFELAVPPRRERLWAATPGKHCRFGLEPVSGSAFRAAVSDWQRPEEPFAGAGPMVRICLPPVASPVRT